MQVTREVGYTRGPWFVGTGWIGAGEIKDGRVIANLHAYPYGDSEANARLIAAAPELLEACKSALERMEVLIDADEATYLDRKVFVKLEDVISKAEGRD